MNKEKLYNKLESMTREQLLELCKSTTNIVDDLQDRIDKAIEYFARRDIEWGSYEQKFLLNILRGEDNES